VRAAVALASPTRDAFAAVQIWLDGATVAHAHVRDASSDFENFHAQFVTYKAGISEKRLFATESVNVGSAHAHAMNPHERLALARRLGFGPVAHR